MPGVLLVEAMAQTGGLLVLSTVDEPERYSTYFMKIDNVKFRHKVVPGDTLIFHVSFLTPMRRGMACYERPRLRGRKGSVRMRVHGSDCQKQVSNPHASTISKHQSRS